MPSRLLIARELSEIFKALAHPDRVRLVEELAASEQDVNTLHDRLGLPAARVSQHLALMRSLHLVDERREGRRHFYHLTQPELARWVLDGLRFIEVRLAEDVSHQRDLEAARRLWAGRENIEVKESA
jgi:DNA-binding transcriptional ArsR family regulator